MTHRSVFFAVVLATVLIGCGGNGGECPPPDAGTDSGTDAGVQEAFALSGLWRFESFSVTDAATSTVTTLTRASSPNALRGDTLFAATGPSSGILSIRLVRLTDGLVDGDVLVQEHLVDIEGDRWAIHTEEGVTEVFTRSIVGETITLTLDPTDPRNEPETGTYTSAIVLTRIPRMARLYGAWELVSLTRMSETTVAGACISRGMDYAILTQSIVIDPRLGMHQRTTYRTFLDDGCTMDAGESITEVTGFVEEDGDTLDFYVAGSSPITIRFDATITEPDVALTRVSCLPAPACESDQPTAVAIRRSEL